VCVTHDLPAALPPAPASPSPPVRAGRPAPPKGKAADDDAPVPAFVSAHLVRRLADPLPSEALNELARTELAYADAWNGLREALSALEEPPAGGDLVTQIDGVPSSLAYCLACSAASEAPLPTILPRDLSKDLARRADPLYARRLLGEAARLPRAISHVMRHPEGAQASWAVRALVGRIVGGKLRRGHAASLYKDPPPADLPQRSLSVDSGESADGAEPLPRGAPDGASADSCSMSSDDEAAAAAGFADDDEVDVDLLAIKHTGRFAAAVKDIPLDVPAPAPASPPPLSPERAPAVRVGKFRCTAKAGRGTCRAAAITALGYCERHANPKKRRRIGDRAGI